MTNVLTGSVENFFDCTDLSSLDFKMGALGDASAFARCFRIFLANTMGLAQPDRPERLGERIIIALKQSRKDTSNIRIKPFRQLLCFSLSALKILGQLEHEIVENLVREQIPDSVTEELDSFGCSQGVPGSGNQAMFLAIFLIHGREYLGLDLDRQIDEWVRYHLLSMNERGFWSKNKWMTHLEFQNGYHQYEILTYLGISTSNESKATSNILSLQDRSGHFAPFPGGSGCYDYDAVFLLTSLGNQGDRTIKNALLRLANAIPVAQNFDGGFSESPIMGARKSSAIMASVRHSMSIRGGLGACLERMLVNTKLHLNPNHRVVISHWSEYQRGWAESDLWNTWFRLRAIQRIANYIGSRPINPDEELLYPGIGYCQ